MFIYNLGNFKLIAVVKRMFHLPSPPRITNTLYAVLCGWGTCMIAITLLSTVYCDQKKILLMKKLFKLSCHRSLVIIVPLSIYIYVCIILHAS